MTDFDDDGPPPLDHSEQVTLAIWLDLVGTDAPCSALTARRLFATIRHQKRQIRRLEATVADLLTTPTSGKT